jgi:hypothetical protein
MLAQLEQHKDLIQAAGLKVVAVGIGEPKHAAHWCGKLAPSAACLVNKTVDVHRAYGLSRGGFRTMLNPKLYTASFRAAAAGFSQGEATGDIAMLGGIFVVDRQGIIRYAYANEVAGDYPPIPDLLKAIGR